MMTAPVPLISSSEDHASVLQSHHAQLARFNTALCQSTPEFSKCLLQLKCQPAPEWQLPPPPKPPSKPQPRVPDVVQEDKQPELVDTPPPKSSTNSTLHSTMLTQAVEAAVEEEVEAAVAELVLLRASLHLQGKARLQYQLQQMLKQWETSPMSSLATEPKQTISSKKSNRTSESTRMLLDSICQSRKSPLPSPLSRETKLQDGSETWEYGLTDSIESMTISPLSGPSSLTSSKPNSKIQTSSNEEELPLKNAACDGLTSLNISPTLKSSPDKPATPKETPKPPTYSSKDCLPESSQTSSNPPMPWDITQLNRRPSELPKPLYSLMQLSRLKDPKLLQAAIEAEEMCLHTHRHLLEEMHCIAHSSAKTMVEAAAATTEETTGTTISNEEDSNSSSSDNTTRPMPHAG